MVIALGRRICCSQEEVDAVYATLKTTACPHCKKVGCLIRHGFLRGYGEQHLREKAVRARRVFCSNRNRADGCGRTFSVWMADKIRRLFLSADSLWAFLDNAVRANNKLQAFRKLNCALSDSAPYRIWKRFQRAQSGIRTALAPCCRQPKVEARHPAQLTLAHLKAAFDHHSLSPIAAFQAALQIFFV